MSQPIDLQQLEKASRRQFSEDGLFYVFLGMLLLVVAVSFAVPALQGLIGLCALLMFPVEALRRRITYPRIGYARFSAQPGAVRGILAFAVATIIILVAIAFAAGGRFQPYLPFAFSIVFALAFYFGTATYGTGLREWLSIALALVTGLFATWRYDDWHDGAAVLFAVLGIVMLLTGLIKLLRFMRRYPLLKRGEEP